MIKIYMPGDYVKTQHGDIYKRVEGTVGGRPAFVDVKSDKKGKLKVGKRKTGLHDSVKLTLVIKTEIDENEYHELEADSFINLEKDVHHPDQY